ncbi:MAG: LysE family translocator [Rhizorhabdus sp.]|nr:LysE family translocator [Rhizorhabdus sp.]
MGLHAWWIFVCATFLVSAMPGPNMLHVMARSIDVGFGRAIFAMAGCMAGLLLLCGLSVAGMSALLAAMPWLFQAIKIAGALYLITIGIKAFRDDGEAASDGATVPAGRLPARILFRDGFLMSISNPKALIFAAAFFPQFIDPAAPKAPQFAILLATFAVIECAWYCTYALCGRSVARHLRKASWRRTLNRVTGGLFVAFGGSLLAWRG